MLKTLRPIFSCILLSSALYGCTAKSWYEGAREGQRSDCAKEYNKSEYEECMEQTKIDYEQYEQKRRESLEAP